MADDELEQEQAPAPDPKAEKARLKAEKKAAKKDKKRRKKGGEGEDDEERETVGSKIAVFLVTLLIIAIWLAIFALLIRADVGGFGSSVMRPVLKNVPILNKILPPDPNAEEDGTAATEDARYRYSSMDEAVAYIKELELQLAEANTSNEEEAAKLAALEAESAKLKSLEQEMVSFEKEKENFYEEVVFSDEAPDINEYIKYYQSIDPENAEVLYQEAVRRQAKSQEMKDYVMKYSSMSAKSAAAIFDAMTDNLGLVAEILTNMDNDSAGAILGKMNADTAAKVTEIMHPTK